MTPTKRYAIKCSTEEQARECKEKGLSYFYIDVFVRDVEIGYTIISYSEAKELGLLGDISKKETTEQQSENILTYEQGIERGRQIGYKEGRRDRSKETTDEKIEKIMNYIFGEYKDSSEGFSVIPNRVRIALKKHLSSKLNKFTEL